MGSRIVTILAIFAQLFDDMIHIPSLIKKSAFNPKIFALAIFQNRRFQGWVQIKPVCGRSELLFFLHGNKKNLPYIKYFELTLVFKQKLGASWKWLFVGLSLDYKTAFIFRRSPNMAPKFCAKSAGDLVSWIPISRNTKKTRLFFSRLLSPVIVCTYSLPVGFLPLLYSVNLTKKV